MKRNAVLLEMTLTLLFLGLSAMVLLRLISSAYAMDAKSREQTYACVILQDAIERVKADRTALAGQGEVEVRFFDADFQPCAKDEASYRAATTVSPTEQTDAGTLYSIRASIAKGAAEVAALESAIYAPEVNP